MLLEPMKFEIIDKADIIRGHRSFHYYSLLTREHEYDVDPDGSEIIIFRNHRAAKVELGTFFSARDFIGIGIPCPIYYK